MYILARSTAPFGVQEALASEAAIAHKKRQLVGVQLWQEAGASFLTGRTSGMRLRRANALSFRFRERDAASFFRR